MKPRTIEDIKRSIKELDTLLEGVSIALGNVSNREGLQLLAQLDEQLRPFIIKYTGLINKSKRYVPVEPAKLQPFVPLATRLSECEEILLNSAGFAYAHALNLILNGFEDAEDAVFTLFNMIKISESNQIYSILSG